MKAQQIAQKLKLPRGFSVVRNSATLCVTDYERVADEIVAALNERTTLLAALNKMVAVYDNGEWTGDSIITARNILVEASK